MAAGGPAQDLCEEATCPICLDYFTDPVSILECGHNFCQDCLAQSWGEKEEGEALSCPKCRGTTRRKSLIPNRTLKNVVEIAKKLSHLGQMGASCQEEVCQKHQEPLKLFCKDHQAPICVVCDRSREHEGHKVVPQEEAFQEYKDQIHSRLKVLKEERKKVLTYKADAEKESQDLLNLTEEERQKTKDGFQQMHQFLEEQEKTLLGEISLVEEEIQRRRDEHLARLCRELSSLENVIQEMEEKCQETVSLFLQDIRKTLQRSEEKEAFGNPVAFPPELTSRIRGFRDVKPLLEGVIKQFRSKANVTLDPDTAHPQLFKQFPANVTLDSHTAHPYLILSNNCRSVRWGDKPQALPDNPERFDRRPFVLGREGFSSGRHFWEVTVEREGDWAARQSDRRKGWFNVGPEGGFWAVGVARKSVSRQDWIDVGPEKGFWAVGAARKSVSRQGSFYVKPEGGSVGNSRGEYYAYHSPDDLRLTLSKEPRRIQVTLDCDEGQVAFFDAERGVHIHTFSGLSFNGETLLPFFSVDYKACLSLFH